MSAHTKDGSKLNLALSTDKKALVDEVAEIG